MKLFLDANIIYSAAKSKLGASYLIFQLRGRFNFQLISSRLALVEAERNITEKKSSETVESFYKLIEVKKIISVDSKQAKHYYKRVIEEKDAPILYGAKQSKADYLITLDRKHFFTNEIKKERFPFKILIPGDFINNLM